MKSVVLVAVFVVFSASFWTVEATYGIDVSQASCAGISLSQWQCMNQRYSDSFAIIQVFFLKISALLFFFTWEFKQQRPGMAALVLIIT
jgi:hypothetical protein